MKNYSRQREAIVRMLGNTVSHPTAEEIYDEVRKELPNIGIATVYRNLKVLEDNEDVLVIRTEDGKYRYDGNVFPHAHLHCTECGAVSDLPLDANQISAIKSIHSDGMFELTYHGLCESCKKALIKSKTC